MKIRAFTLLIALVQLPIVISAQTPTPGHLDLQSFGDGWQARDIVLGSSGIYSWYERLTLVGPSGSVVTIDLYQLGPSDDVAASQWEFASKEWEQRCRRELVGQLEDIFTNDSELPSGATNAIRASSIDGATGEPAAIGLYSIREYDVALMVRVHGTVANLEGELALNWVVSMWLSAQQP